MDTFPALVVYTALLGLSKDPGQWSELSTGDNLLFTDEDFQPPFTTKVWQLLTNVNDDEVARAAATLRLCCDPGWRADESLDAVLSSAARLVVGPSTPPRWQEGHEFDADGWWVNDDSPPTDRAQGPPSFDWSKVDEAVPDSTEEPVIVPGAPATTTRRKSAGRDFARSVVCAFVVAAVAYVLTVQAVSGRREAEVALTVSVVAWFVTVILVVLVLRRRRK